MHLRVKKVVREENVKKEHTIGWSHVLDVSSWLKQQKKLRMYRLYARHKEITQEGKVVWYGLRNKKGLGIE